MVTENYRFSSPVYYSQRLEVIVKVFDNQTKSGKKTLPSQSLISNNSTLIKQGELSISNKLPNCIILPKKTVYDRYTGCIHKQQFFGFPSIVDFHCHV